jgi:hypothetical protein
LQVGGQHGNVVAMRLNVAAGLGQGNFFGHRAGYVARQVAVKQVFFGQAGGMFAQSQAEAGQANGQPGRSPTYKPAGLQQGGGVQAKAEPHQCRGQQR